MLQSGLVERYSWLVCCFLWLLVIVTLLTISLQLPPTLLKPWLSRGTQALLALMTLREMIYFGRLVFRVVKEDKGEKEDLIRPGPDVWKRSRREILGRFIHFAGTGFLFLATLWLTPFWLHLWKWNILRLLTSLLVVAAFIRFLVFSLAVFAGSYATKET